MPHIVHVGPAAVSPAAYEARVRMRDGVHLAADVYLPGWPDVADDEPGDTILIRLPYDKSGEYTFIPLIAEYFTARGYRVVAQDVRGKFRSEGDALLFVNEVDDGYDTIEWLIHQPWSNGRVAMWGDSYYGYTQWAAVASQHPALKAIAPRVTGTQLGEPVVFPAGERLGPVEWAITLLYPLTYFHSRDAYFWELDAQRRPFSAQAEEVMVQLGARSLSYDQWYPRPVHLPRFPLASAFDARPVPVLHTIGWWDNCAPLSWADVAEIDKRPAWALNHFLRIESMDHEAFYLDDRASERTEERSAEDIRAQLPRMLDPALDFFEVFMRGNGSAADVPRVAWNLAGSPGMRTSPTWPPPEVEASTLFATAEGRLAVEPPATATFVEWTHDPADLVPSTVPNAFAYLLYAPDEAALTARADVLAFDTEPFVRDVELTGPVRVEASVSSDGPVMDVFARLLDVAPDGTALRIARGQVQVRGAQAPALVDIDLGQAGYRLRAGHRLRLHVHSSDFPEFLPQPGTGEEPWGAVESASNRQRVVVGGDDALRVSVTVRRPETRGEE
ncbi:CocE/NonD family hydrolase [Microbacterium sp. HD4P20]|uniref:CocE/NonD family hydrolase n=1 Tax=Microbacterium sp. HD4P20 TaxID=2864874 RepID=UPI0020A5FA08|nr:CocE/NonD family hydrolase [Microbacterium sp. HD4P20]MCP2636088.1 CocE/NonD family hydrolase [Microbacterium sp. HD4P20]